VTVFLWLAVALLAVLLFSFSVYAFAVGGAGMLEGASFERCPRCGRHGLVLRDRLHAKGCPHPSYRQRWRHWRDAWSSGLHLGHH
jgi:ribosomal protein L37E